MIRVEFLRSDLAVVVDEPSWPARFFLRRDGQERFAVALPCINGGRNWYWDHNGRPVEPDVHKAIDREIVRLEWQRIIAKRGAV